MTDVATPSSARDIVRSVLPDLQQFLRVVMLETKGRNWERWADEWLRQRPGSRGFRVTDPACVFALLLGPCARSVVDEVGRRGLDDIALLRDLRNADSHWEDEDDSFNELADAGREGAASLHELIDAWRQRRGLPPPASRSDDQARAIFLAARQAASDRDDAALAAAASKAEALLRDAEIDLRPVSRRMLEAVAHSDHRRPAALHDAEPATGAKPKPGPHEVASSPWVVVERVSRGDLAVGSPDLATALAPFASRADTWGSPPSLDAVVAARALVDRLDLHPSIRSTLDELHRDGVQRWAETAMPSAATPQDVLAVYHAAGAESGAALKACAERLADLLWRRLEEHGERIAAVMDPLLRAPDELAGETVQLLLRRADLRLPLSQRARFGVVVSRWLMSAGRADDAVEASSVPACGVRAGGGVRSGWAPRGA